MEITLALKGDSYNSYHTTYSIRLTALLGVPQIRLSISGNDRTVDLDTQQLMAAIKAIYDWQHNLG